VRLEQVAVVSRQFAGRVGLFLRVDDFDRHYERMRSADVEFVGETRSEPYGRVAIFLDVAGNRWDLLRPHRSWPTWPPVVVIASSRGNAHRQAAACL
jgi:hypothetical protein